MRGLCLYLMSVVMLSSAQIRQYFIREPDNQTAIEGEQVTLPCRVQNKIGIIQWTRDGFGLGDTRDLSGYSRYKLIGSDDEKDWTLQISPVLLEDDALFQCQVGAADGVAPIRSQNAQLTVYVPPEDPYIVQGELLEVTEDMETRLECVSPGGKPAADIYWHDGEGHVMIQNVRTYTTILEDGKRYNTTSIIVIRPRKRHHNKTFTCSASNIADRSRRSVSILLQVRYAPSVQLSSSSRDGGGMVKEGDSLQFHCTAHANPHPTGYSWFVDGQKASGFQSDYFVITNISQAYHNSIVKCEVRNEIGKSEETETIQVRYGPKLVRQPQTVAGDLGDSATLHCLVDSNPEPTYTWTKGLSRQAVGSSQNLTLIVSERTEGQYFCHSITEGYDLLTSSPASILLRRRPSLTSPETQVGQPGDILRVVCSAVSAPQPTGVSWTFLGRTIQTENSKYEIVTNMDGFTFESTLIIRESSSEDFGYYGCAITNALGSVEASIYLEKEEEFSLLLILIGIFATIIIILVITLLFLLCRHKISQICSHKEDKPYKPNNINSLPPYGSNKTSLGEVETEGWDDVEEVDHKLEVFTNTNSTNNRLSTYQTTDFPPKPDLISTEYSVYGGCSSSSLPPSDSQTSLHSASQLSSLTNRHSTVLNVTDPRYSATYGNPYLRSPPKLSTYSNYNTYSTFSPSDTSYNPVSYIASPASTNTVHSMVSVARSVTEPPLPPPPIHNTGGSIVGITGSPASHHRHQVGNDLYAVVSKTGNNLRNLNSVSSPVNYILDTGPASQAGTHV